MKDTVQSYNKTLFLCLLSEYFKFTYMAFSWIYLHLMPWLVFCPSACCIFCTTDYNIKLEKRNTKPLGCHTNTQEYWGKEEENYSPKSWCFGFFFSPMANFPFCFSFNLWSSLNYQKDMKKDFKTLQPRDGKWLSHIILYICMHICIVVVSSVCICWLAAGWFLIQ